jgi:hypothetical protein
VGRSSWAAKQQGNVLCHTWHKSNEMGRQLLTWSRRSFQDKMDVSGALGLAEDTVGKHHWFSSLDHQYAFSKIWHSKKGTTLKIHQERTNGLECESPRQMRLRMTTLDIKQIGFVAV